MENNIYEIRIEQHRHSDVNTRGPFLFGVGPKNGRYIHRGKYRVTVLEGDGTLKTGHTLVVDENFKSYLQDENGSSVELEDPQLRLFDIRFVFVDLQVSTFG